MGRTEIILSTGNIVSGGPSILRKPGGSRSNLELISSLKSHFSVAKEDYATVTNNGDGRRKDSIDIWTSQEEETLYVPRIEWSTAGLHEEASQYDITVKIFFLPMPAVSERERHIQRALDLVLKELKVDSIDLLIASFPGLSFEGDCEWAADKKNATQGNHEDEIATWSLLEGLHKKGIVKSLGVADFGSEKLQKFISNVQVKPAVDQINVRDCCNVPPPLVELAKSENVELLAHTDCTDILPPGTFSDILGPQPQGAGVLPGMFLKQDGSSHPQGTLIPEWVIKYTAVIRDRGVIENKGYFAGGAFVSG